MNPGDLFPLAVGVAISPIPVIAVIVLLFSRRARSNSLAFLLGWAGAVFVTGGVILLRPGAETAVADNAPSLTGSLVKVFLGLLFLVLAGQQWRARPRTTDANVMPRWLASIDSFTPLRSLAAGAVLFAINVKNLTLTFTAVLRIEQAAQSTIQSMLGLLLFALLSSLSVLIPLVYFWLAGARAEKRLNAWKAWLAANNAAVMVVLFLFLAVVIGGPGVWALMGG